MQKEMVIRLIFRRGRRWKERSLMEATRRGVQIHMKHGMVKFIDGGATMALRSITSFPQRLFLGFNGVLDLKFNLKTYIDHQNGYWALL